MKILFIVFISFLSVCINRAQSIGKPNYSCIKIADSQERIFYSDIYKQNITLQVYLPVGYEKTDSTFSKYPNLQKKTLDSYPVLYLLDSDIYFGMAATISRLLQWENKSPGLIIVGISYGISEWKGKREHDYYPFPDTSLKVPGEAYKFLEMHKKELIPYIESNFRADANNRILFGHSAGGIFTLYALFTEPRLFQGYISASTWLKYLPKFFFDIEEKYSEERNDMPAKLYLSMGILEQKEGFSDWERFIDIFAKRNYNNLKLKKVIIEDEGHLSSAPISLVKGIQWYFSEE